jgi:SAM-dependent methyltransferase
MRLSSVALRLGVPARSNLHHWGPAAAFYELRWKWRVRRAPVMTADEHAASVARLKRRYKRIEEVIGCSLCGETRMQPLLHPRGRRRNYHVVRCPACGLLYRHPGIRPDRLGDLYSEDYNEFLEGHYAQARRRRYELALDAFAPLFAGGDGRRLLDFGCGNGLFMEAAHARGFDTYGVDLAADAVEAARGRPGGAKAFFGSPLEVPEIAAGGFDVITMWSVLAHLPRPVEDLTMLRGLLADDGVLLVLTINANSLLLKRQLDDWGAFTPGHLKFFAPDTLRRLLERAGFGSVVFRTMYSDDIEAGTSALPPREQRRLKRAVERGNRAGMLRAVAFADPGGPARWF